MLFARFRSRRPNGNQRSSGTLTAGGSGTPVALSASLALGTPLAAAGVCSNVMLLAGGSAFGAGSGGLSGSGFSGGTSSSGRAPSDADAAKAALLAKVRAAGGLPAPNPNQTKPTEAATVTTVAAPHAAASLPKAAAPRAPAPGGVQTKASEAYNRVGWGETSCELDCRKRGCRGVSARRVLLQNRCRATFLLRQYKFSAMEKAGRSCNPESGCCFPLQVLRDLTNSIRDGPPPPRTASNPKASSGPAAAKAVSGPAAARKADGVRSQLGLSARGSAGGGGGGLGAEERAGAAASSEFAAAFAGVVAATQGTNLESAYKARCTVFRGHAYF